MKTKTILLVLILGLIFSSGCLQEKSNTAEIKRISPSDTEKSQIVKDYQASTTTISKAITTMPPAKEPKIGNLGDILIVDDIAHTVDKVESYTQIGSEMFGKKTAGYFYKVYLTIENRGSKTQNLFTPRFKMIDDQGREFEPSIEAEIYIKDAIRFGEQLQPGLPMSGGKIFELPKTSTGLKLEVRGDWKSVSKIVVNIDESKIVKKEKETSAQDAIDKDMDEATKKAQEQLDELMRKYNV